MGKLKSVEELFEGRHFDREVIILCVRWYLRFKLSLRDLVEMTHGFPQHARLVGGVGSDRMLISTSALLDPHSWSRVSAKRD